MVSKVLFNNSSSVSNNNANKFSYINGSLADVNGSVREERYEPDNELVK